MKKFVKITEYDSTGAATDQHVREIDPKTGKIDWVFNYETLDPNAPPATHPPQPER